MINSGKLIEQISYEFGVLRHEISQSGKIGLGNIHKHSENLIRKLLNIAYDLDLVDLNEGGNSFPGLDIGDRDKGVAYQITADKSSNKVIETLDKVNKFKHYRTFNSIKIFVLGSKQSAYSIPESYSNQSRFDWKNDIIDFDDLLKAITQLDLPNLELAFGIIEAELASTIKSIKQEGEQYLNRNHSLIIPRESMNECGANYFRHSVVRVRFPKGNYSTAVLFKSLQKFYAADNKISNLYLFDPIYRKSQSSNQIDFEDKLHGNGTLDYFSQGRLQITQNQIAFETASYQNEETMLTGLNGEVDAITTLLIFAFQSMGFQKSFIELDFDLLTNGKLSYMSQNSPLKVLGLATTPILNPNSLRFSKVIKDTTDKTLNGIYNEILEGFVTEGRPGYFHDPFLSINTIEQDKVNNWFRNYFSLSLQDLD